MEPLFTDTPLIQTPVYNGQFRFSRRKKNSYTFSKINPLNADTAACPIGVSLRKHPRETSPATKSEEKRMFSQATSVSVLTGFHFFYYRECDFTQKC